MDDCERPWGMVMLASEQLWPNLHGLIHWHDRAAAGRLGDVCIYYTGNAAKSGQPARRLARFCRTQYPQIRVHLPPSACGLEPAEVAGRIAAWQAELPGRRWVVNATGGIKLMFAGALQCARLPDTTVVYRELSGDWFSLTLDGGCVLSRRLEIPVGETDAISVMQLIDAQWDPQGAHWTASDPEPLDVLRLTQLGLADNWRWETVFPRAGYAADQRRGLLFERFVAAVLLELGVRNLKANVKLQADEPLEEIDLVANHGGRLLVFDCKLPGQADEAVGRTPKLTEQIRTAEATQRSLGGLDARTLLIRPDREFSASHRMLAEAYRLRVLDRAASPQLFARLAEFAGVRVLPPAVQAAADAVLDACQAQGAGGAFAVQRRRLRAPTAARDGGNVLNVDAMLQAERAAARQDWVCYLLNNKLYLRARNPQRWTAAELPHQLQQRLGPEMAVTIVSRSQDGDSFLAQLRPPQNRPRHADRALAPYRGRSLLGDPT